MDRLSTFSTGLSPFVYLGISQKHPPYIGVAEKYTFLEIPPFCPIYPQGYAVIHR
jgi:hypothetical protein